MISLILRLVITIIIAFFIGKLVSKFKLPAILGWLITGMILGPHALSIVNETLLDANWYNTFIHVLECAVGLLIGTELVWKKIKKTGKQIVITTLTQSLGTFILVSLAFGVIFYFTGIPIYLGIIFGGIALATAPAPALSIVREFKTDGPVTKTLIPMAALDDIVAVIVFFSSISIISAGLSEQKLPAYMIALVILLPLIIGVATGLIAGIVLKKERNKKETLALLIIMIIFASAIGFFFNNYVMPKPVLNFMLIGMAFSATFSNMISEKRLEQIMNNFNPILGFSMIVVILNLGAPLNYHLILNAGLYTAIYIIVRALGKYFGAYFGASITKSPETVKKYLGLTLLPHSGVSLVFTGIAVSVLSNSAPECAQIIQGTIAAAAVINEIIAVIIAKKGFELAGEFNKNCISATFSNMISEKRLEQIMNNFNPILGFSMIVVILNLGAPLNYHLILNAGLYTAIYIIVRALGKYFGAYFGASITKSPETVKKYLGLTLLPHSGVSLVFTGIAVSVLSNPAPECAQIIQGTIAAAAVMNEIIAVIIAKKGFELAGEFNKNCNVQNDNSDNLIAN